MALSTEDKEWVQRLFEEQKQSLEEQFGKLFNRAYSIFATKQDLEGMETRILTGIERMLLPTFHPAPPTA